VIDFDVARTFQALVRTLPFIILRIAVYAGIALAYVLSVGVGAGIGAAIALLAGGPGAGALWGGLIGFGIVSIVLLWARRYLLYLVKAAHIAVLVEVLDGGELPAGRGQVEHGRRVVTERFIETSVLFGIDLLIKGVLRILNRTLFTLSGFVPLPGLRNLVALIARVVNMSLTYTDEIILAHNIRVRSDNPWESSREALVLYAQNYGAMLRNSVFLLVVIWALTIAVFVVFLAPAGAIAALFPNAVGGTAVLTALVAAWAVKAALLEPFAVAALMQVFFKVTADQAPDPEWDRRLAGMSKKFVALKRQASAHSAGNAPGDAAAGQPA